LEIFITTDPNFKGFPEFISSGDALWTHFVIENKPPMKKVYNSEDFFDSFGSNLWVARFWVTVDSQLKEAEEVFTRMLWLNPTDNQGIRFLLGKVKERKVVTMT
jgi:hypothetical protein